MKRNVSVDILKLLMAFMVVGIHAGFLSDFSDLGEYLFVNGIFRIAVPIFLIINGFYFFSAISKNDQFAWIRRVLLLYLAWMAFYSYFWFSVPEGSMIGVIEFFLALLIGYHHLWYISGMLGAAIIMIMLRKSGSGLLVATIVVTFLMGVAIQYAGNYHLLDDVYLDELFNKSWVHRNFLLLSYPFFCLGFLIHKHSLHQRISYKITLALSILGLVLLFVESYVNFIQPNRDGGFDNFVSLLLVSPAVFIFFIKQNIRGQSKLVALYSSSIYLIHSFVLSVFMNLTGLKGTLLTVSVITVSMMVSIFIIGVNNKLKFIL